MLHDSTGDMAVLVIVTKVVDVDSIIVDSDHGYDKLLCFTFFLYTVAGELAQISSSLRICWVGNSNLCVLLQQWMPEWW